MQTISNKITEILVKKEMPKNRAQIWLTENRNQIKAPLKQIPMTRKLILKIFQKYNN